MDLKYEASLRWEPDAGGDGRNDQRGSENTQPCPAGLRESRMLASPSALPGESADVAVDGGVAYEPGDMSDAFLAPERLRRCRLEFSQWGGENRQLH